MKIPISYHRDNSFSQPTECPLCHYAIEPVELARKEYEGADDQRYLSVMYMCNHCERSFLAFCRYDYFVSGYVPRLEYIGPNAIKEIQFAHSLELLSPQFVKIYNQALAAESYGLDEIAGVGYRKAVEFLVKDYCIHIAPDQEETIKKEFLGSCIKNCIDNKKIKTLAELGGYED